MHGAEPAHQPADASSAAAAQYWWCSASATPHTLSRCAPAACCPAGPEQQLVESYFSALSTLPSTYFLGYNRTDQTEPYAAVTLQTVSQTPVNSLLYAHWCWTFNPLATYFSSYIYHCVVASSSCKYDRWGAGSSTFSLARCASLSH